jgi:hemolysin activation/secretion protein
MQLARWCSLAVCSTLLWCATAVGQVPPTVEPGRVEEQRRAPTEPQRPDSATVQPPQVEPQRAPENAKDLLFVLQRLTVEGAKAYSADELTAPYGALIGQQVSLDRLYQIANEMTARYRNDGYLLSSVVVPAQNIRDGAIRLQAVEGYLASVAIEGDVHRRDGLFESLRQQLLADRPLRTATLERAVLLMNDLAGTVAQAILRPAASAQGATDLLVKVATQTVAATVGATNRGSELQGPVQYEASLELRSILGLHENTVLSYLQSSEREELWLGSLTHTQRLTAGGLDLTLGGSVSRSDPDLGVELNELNLETDTDQASVQLSYPLLRARTGNLHARAALTYHDGLSDSDFGPISQDVITAVRVGLACDSVDAWSGVNLIDLELSQGVEAFGSSKEGDPLASRIGGDPEFSKATLYLARLQSLGAKWSILLAASGQAAFTNLLAPEEFAFGGEFYGRAYDPSEIVGDSGLAGKAELRFTHDRPGFGLTLYGFYEAGKVWRRLDASEVDTDKEASAASAGGGMRFTFGRYASAYVEAAVPLNHIVAAEGNDDTRVFGGIQVGFGN